MIDGIPVDIASAYGSVGSRVGNLYLLAPREERVENNNTKDKRSSAGSVDPKARLSVQ
jgi:hypothetical protein